MPPQNWLHQALDRLLPPTAERLSAQLLRLMREAGAEVLAHDVAREQLRIRVDGSEQSVSLANVLREAPLAARPDRPAVLARFVRGLLSSGRSPWPTAWAQAQTQLLPVVRHRFDAEQNALALSVNPNTAAAPPMAHRLLAGDWSVGLVLDQPDTMVRLNTEHLEKWGVGFEAALQAALHHLRGLPEHGGWRPLAPGLWSGEWGDSYESSRLLLPDLIHRLGLPEPVVMAPVRNSLLVCSARDEAALAQLAHWAQRRAEESPRWVSLRAMRLTDAGWAPFEPPPACSEAFATLLTLDAASAHNAQCDDLQQWHEARQDEVFVAKVVVFRPEGGGPARTLAVWSRGVDTLLPEADFIALNPQPDIKGSHQLLPWAAARAAFPDYFEASPWQPPRWRLRRFPSDAERAVLP
ncbi:MAG: hypothetical protein ACK5O3_19085 [Burkholderiales bacterium]